MNFKELKTNQFYKQEKSKLEFIMYFASIKEIVKYIVFDTVGSMKTTSYQKTDFDHMLDYGWEKVEMKDIKIKHKIIKILYEIK